MCDKSYSSNVPTYPLTSNVYNNRSSCTKQPLDPNQQFYCNMPGVSANNPSYNQPNLLEPFNVISPQQNCIPKNQSVCMYPTQMDVSNWESRLCEEAIKLPDKIDMIEISSKDLSPASYCSNLDILMPDFYKNVTSKEAPNYYNQSQWYSNTNTGGYNTQKLSEYPSCAQSNQAPLCTAEKTVKYCSIQTMQKSQEFDYNINNASYNNGLMYNNDQNFSLQQDFYGGGYYDPKVQDAMQSQQYFEMPADSFHGLDQQTECSNDESDIIVEDSEEETADFQDFAKKFPSEANKCIICNISYTPLGTQFYYLTLKSPLTMSSQKPVFAKIVSIVGRIYNKVNYLCSACLGLINTIDHLQLKLENFNTELIGKFQKTCTENNYAFQRKRRKRKSSSLKINAKIKCKTCSKVLSLKQMCIKHAKRHKVSFLCELCGSVFSTRKRFQFHFTKHHRARKPKIDSFQCSNCPKSFRTKSNLIEHENYCLGILPFACKYCDKKFASSTKLKNHVKLKHDKKFMAICSICNIGFVTLSDYKAHKVSHSTDKKFSCDKCDKAYKTLSNLNFHMKIHNKQLPFLCEICDKGFMRKDYLEAHINNHNGVKNFACSICDKKFVSQKNLDSHLKYHDGSSKRKTCNICGKVMTTGFEEHLRIHNNLREFECDQCEDRFNTKGTLAKHKKRKHSSNDVILVE